MDNFLLRSMVYLMWVCIGIVELTKYEQLPITITSSMIIVLGLICVYTEYKKNRSWPTNIVKGMLFLTIAIEWIYADGFSSVIEILAICWFFFISFIAFRYCRSEETLLFDWKLPE